MASFVLDAVQAHKGDALVVRWGDDSDGHIMLVDGGPGSVYEDFLLPHLQAVVGANPIGQPNPIALDAVVVSHVDDDHINGILDLAEAIFRARQSSLPVPLSVAEVWHNAFADMAFLADFADEPELQAAIQRSAANPASLAALTSSGVGAQPSEALEAGIQSIRQGRRLDQRLDDIHVPRNARFADRDGFVRAGPAVDLEGLSVTVLAPNDELLAALKREWQRELRKLLEKEIEARVASIEALAAAFDDPSVPNQSSIVLLVELDGKRMLLTGDARGDHLIAALEGMDVTPAEPLRVDLFKVPHHGSARSNGRQLFDLVHADHYVISGNGEHGNPHPDALRDLLASATGRRISLHLTNRPTAGASKPEDLAKAQAAQQVLDEASSDPNVTIRYRDDGAPAISVRLD